MLYFFKAYHLLTPLSSSLHFYICSFHAELFLSSLLLSLFLTSLSPSVSILPFDFHTSAPPAGLCLSLSPSLFALVPLHFYQVTKGRNTKLQTTQISLRMTPNLCRMAPTVMISFSNLCCYIFASWDVFVCLRADMQNN